MLKNKYVKTFLKLAVSAGLLWWVLSQVDWRKALEIVQRLTLVEFLVYVLLLIAGILISAYKWKLIASYKEFSYPFRRHFQWYLMGTFFNNFLPSIVGGDTYRALILGKRNNRRSPAISTILFDRVTGLWALAGLAFIFALPVFTQVIEYPLWTLLVVGSGLFFLFEFITLPGSRLSLYAFMRRWMPERLKHLFEELDTYRSRPFIAKTFLWGALFSVVGVGLANFVLFEAFDANISLVEFFSVIFLISIISAFPVSINNIGVKEWGYYTFFGFLGVSPEIAVTSAILSRFVQMIISFFAIPGYVRGKKEAKKESPKNERPAA